MGTKVHSNYEDLITFTRASTGHALRPVSYGDELVTNGTFDTDSDWIKGSSWSISGGVASTDGTVIGATLRQELTNTAIGTLLFIEYTISGWNSTGTHNALLGATPSSDNTGNGTFYVALVQNGDKEINIQTKGGAAFSVDNVSVKEVFFDQPDGTLTLFEHPTNVPRVEYDADRNRLGLLVEEARTNLITYSEDLADSSWNKGGSTTVTTNFTESPDKQDNGVRIQMPASIGTYASRSFSATSGTEYTISLWAKDNGGGSFNFGYASTVSSGVTDGSTVTATGEWVRYSHTFTAPSTGTYYIAIDNVSNTSAVDALIFGVQLEAGSFPTSYIKTTGSTTTRSADVASIPVADFGYNQSAGTLFVDFSVVGEGTNSAYANALTDESTNNMIIQFRQAVGTLRTGIVSGGTDVTSGMDTGSADVGDSLKFASAFSTDDIAQSLNGASVQTDTSATVPSNISSLRIGNRDDNTRPLNGHIKSIKYYPRRLTNAQLQALTS